MKFSGAQRGQEHADAPNELAAEAVELLSAQSSSRGELADDPAVCRAFAGLLLSRWPLCSVSTHLRDAAGRLRPRDSQTREGLDARAVSRAADWLAAEASRAGHEIQVWLDETADESAAASRATDEGATREQDATGERDATDESRATGEGAATTNSTAASESEAARAADELQGARPLFESAGLSAGLAVPVRVRGATAGALVVLTTRPEELRAARDGVRFAAAPLAVALGNARRRERLDEQRGQIEHLYEELRERTAELEEANRELRRVSRYRSLFLSRMSHELRTPLTSMLGFTEIMLEHGRLSDSQRGFCEKIQQSGQKLRTKVNQLVDLSRLEAGRAELFLHEFSLRETLRESCEAVARLAEKQRVALDCETDPSLSMIVSDEGKLRQVFYNLLAHAIGRTPAGGTVRVRASACGEGRARVEITDEGEGALDAAHLFEPVDADPPSEQGTNMNELGLVIAHRLVAALAGRVEPAADDPRGLTLRVEIPTRPPAP